MKTVIILAQAKRAGFNRALADSLEESLSGEEPTLFDLYADGFNPVMPAEELPRKFSFDETTLHYQQSIRDADRLVFIHPDWWGGPPAIMKGFLDRVFRPGVAYGFREADFRDAEAPGLFAGKQADVFISTDASPPASGHVFDWPPAAVWKDNVMAFCGITRTRVHVFWNLRDSTYGRRHEWIVNAPSLLNAP